MYNNGKTNKSSKIINILVGIIAILVIIFLVIFLVNRNNGNKAVETKQQFNDNLNLLHQTAKEFFAAQLPDEVGGSLQTSLKELVEMGAIDELEYNGQKCDLEQSYVSVTKTSEDEYRVKSNLVCGDKSDSTIEKVKSNTTVTNPDGSTVVDENHDDVDLEVEQKPNSSDSNVQCKDFKCTVEQIPSTCTVTYEYEYVKRTVSCPSGYTISGSICSMETSDAVPPTPMYSEATTTIESAKVNPGTPYKVYADPIVDKEAGNYYCTEGQLIGDKCVLFTDKITNTTESCPAGYNRVGDYCYLYADKSNGSTTSVCPNGYTDNGTNCYVRVAVTKTTDTSCPSGYTKVGNSCYAYTNKVTSSTPESCPAGYTREGNYCYKYADKVADSSVVCPPEYTKVGNSCYKYTNKISTSSTSCPSGYVQEGNYCYQYTTKTYTNTTTCPSGYTKVGDYCYLYANKVTSSSCPSGYTDNGSNCYKRTSITTTSKSVCPDGYTESGSTCYKRTNLTTTTKSVCPDGYKESGSRCVKQASLQTSSSCPGGTTPSNGKCLKTISAVKSYTPWGNPVSEYQTSKRESTYTKDLEKKIELGPSPLGVYTYSIYRRTSYYTCSQGTLSGTQCLVYSNPTVTTKCPTGYTQEGNSCYAYANKVTSSSSTCPSGYTQSGNYCYQYANKVTSSSSTCPSGYTQSGNYCYQYVNKTTKSSCPSGYTESGSTCYKRTNLNTSTTSSCPSGYTESGSTCYKRTNLTTSSSSTCPSGYSDNGYNCVAQISGSYSYNYSCPSGYTDNGSRCYIRQVVSNTTTSVCPSGYTDNGSNCYTTTNPTSSTSTSCPAGYTKNGDYCYAYADKIVNSTPGTCPNGFTDGGTTCYKKVDPTKNSNSTCPDGYTDNGTNCMKNVAANYADGTTVNKCPDGYTLSKNGDNVECFKYETTENQFYCEDANAELKGTLCYTKHEATFLQNKCEYGYTLGADNMCHSSSVLTASPIWTDVDYKYSSEDIPGYQKTGRGTFHQTCVRTDIEEDKPTHWK